jgi:prefoldin subunit 2
MPEYIIPCSGKISIEKDFRIQAKRKQFNDPGKSTTFHLMGEDEKPAAKENSEGAGAKASSAGVLVF